MNFLTVIFDAYHHLIRETVVTLCHVSIFIHHDSKAVDKKEQSISDIPVMSSEICRQNSEYFLVKDNSAPSGNATYSNEPYI